MATYSKLMMQKSSAVLAATLALCLVAVGCGDDDDDDVPVVDVGADVADVGEDVAEDVAEDIAEDAEEDIAEDVAEDAEEDVEEDVGEDVADAPDVGDAGEVGDAAGPGALVQFIHASPDEGAIMVDVWVNDQKLLDDFEYLTATPFLTVPANTELEVDITAATATDNSDPVYSQTISADALSAGDIAVGIASGLIGENFAVRLSGAQQSAGSDQVALQIFHGAPDAPAVDVTAADGAVTLAQELSFGNFTDIETLDALDTTAEVTLAGTSAVVASFGVPLSQLAGQYVTVVARGTVDTTDDTPFGVTVFTADGTAIDLSE